MIIDFHSHLAPPKWRETKPLPPSLTDIDGFFAAKEAAGVDFSVIANPMMNLPGSKQNDLSLEMIQAYNEFAYDLVSAHPGKLAALPGINPFGGPDVLQELERAVRDAGFPGVCVNTSIEGEFLDSPRADDFWALAAELDVPVFVHPPALPPGSTGLTDFRLVEHIARPGDVTLALTSAIFAGVLERYPNLKLIGAVGGGNLAMVAWRLDMAHQSGQGRPGAPPMGAGGPPPGAGGPPAGGPPGGGPPRGGAPPFLPPGMMMATNRLSQPPSGSLGQVYVDSVTYSTPALLCNIQVFGADHVLFGTDFPAIRFPVTRAIEMIRELPIDEEDKEKILWKNTAALLKLEVA